MTDRSGTSPSKVLRNLAPLSLLAIALTGCASKDKGGALPCPMVVAPRELAHVTNFAPGGTDLSDISFEAGVDTFSSYCKYSANAEQPYIRTAIKVQFIAARGPKFTGDKASFKYFVAITGPGGTLEKKEIFDSDIDLSGDKVKNITVDEIDPIKVFPKEKENGDFYRIYIGLDLTKEQLDYNKRNPR
ncbi:MAG: hypothetical protein E6Q98_08405 [Rhodospirillaceae bacterium]|nr:MAG: hypothetical protein E6Q98_08405 [Rhodospirillaceae bacterium]